MTLTYIKNKSFSKFVRSVIALPFLPINEIEAAVDELRLYSFPAESPMFKEMKEFQEYFLEYFERAWLHGNFHSKVWNYWRKYRGLTNNR